MKKTSPIRRLLSLFDFAALISKANNCFIAFRKLLLRHRVKILKEEINYRLVINFFFFFQMPMELADKINEIEDIDDFLHDFVDSNSLENLTSLAHPRDISRRREFKKYFFFIFIFLFQFEQFQNIQNIRSELKISSKSKRSFRDQRSFDGF